MQKTVRGNIALSLLLMMSAGRADEIPWEGEPMVVTGTATDGGNILCVRSGCAGILDQLAKESLYRQMTTQTLAGLIDADTSYDLSIDRGEFCEELEDGRPAGCSRSTPPSVPLLDGAWRPNGCGVGGWRDAALGIVATLALPHFTGDLDAPFPGVSFLAACNDHDQCYGLQAGKFTCDGLFRNSMADACGASTSGDAFEICLAAGSAYHLAVTAHGDVAYETAGEHLSCARWHLEMKINGCA